MQNETIEKVEKEIVQKTTVPNELKEKIRREVFLNILLAIAIIVYFIFLMLGSIDTIKVSRSVDFKIFSLLLLFISIALFEIAYKKDNGKLAINGIEILLVAMVTLFLPYIVFELDSIHQKYYILSMSLIAIYYIIKSIIIGKKAKKAYVKAESDIKEITKKENKNANMLDEQIEEKSKIKTKKLKEVKLKEAKQDKDNKKEDIINKKSNKINNVKKESVVKNIKKQETPQKEEVKKEEKEQAKEEIQKRRGRPKKENIEKDSKKQEVSQKEKAPKEEKEQAKEETQKRRGRPKKENVGQESKKQEKQLKEEVKQEEEEKPKRGRPRKAVSSK